VERWARVRFQHPEVFKSFLSNLVDVLRSVFVLGGLHCKMKLAVGLIGFIEAIRFWYVSV